MIRKLGYLIIIVIASLNVSNAQSDSVRVSDMTTRIDSLTNEVTKLQTEVKELQIGKSYYDIIIGSQMNVFMTLLAVIVAVLTAINFKAIFRDLPKQAKEIGRIDTVITQHQKSIDDTRFNSNRAFFLGHLNRENYDWATIIALRCVELSTINKDQAGVLSWVKSAAEAYAKAKPQQVESFKEKFLREATQRLELAEKMEDVDDPQYFEKISQLKTKLNS